jgi:hypothetical protein
MSGNFGLMPIVRVTIKSANRPIISHQTPKTANRCAHRPRWRGRQIAVETTLVVYSLPLVPAQSECSTRFRPLRENRKTIQINRTCENRVEVVGTLKLTIKQTFSERMPADLQACLDEIDQRSRWPPEARSDLENANKRHMRYPAVTSGNF